MSEATRDVRTVSAFLKTATWEKGLRPYLAYRDVGVKAATNGRVDIRVIRATQPCAGPGGYHSHSLDFQWVYVLKGWTRVYWEDVGEVRYEAGDAYYQPPGIKHEHLAYSDDLESLEITMPAEFSTQDESR